MEPRGTWRWPAAERTGTGGWKGRPGRSPCPSVEFRSCLLPLTRATSRVPVLVRLAELLPLHAGLRVLSVDERPVW